MTRGLLPRLRPLAVPIAITASLSPAPLFAHDIFTGLKSIEGTSCCSDQDCERLSAEQVRTRGRTILVDSRRYRATVVIPVERIQWEPVAGLEPAFVGVWCGAPRRDLQRSQFGIGVGPRQPDARMLTFCIFIRPPGS